MIVWFPLCYDQSKIQRKEKKNCEKNLSCSEPPCDNVGFWAAPTSNLPYTNVQFLSICYYSRVTSLKQLSIAEFSGEYTRPKVYENGQKKVLGIWFDLVLKVKYSKILIFKAILLCQKSAESLPIFFSLKNTKMGG